MAGVRCSPYGRGQVGPEITEEGEEMSEEVEKVLFPQVQWAQRKQLIILRVLVKPVEASI